ncbi:odorant receptor 30a-like [Vespa crabro]|uniref:odorant receptor 30a-like n=1 Tax=Vespa crabro TaxID=7445 RepID=UPI001F00EBB9|nr:odorant receptor 30a-like [Vespa crabro]
MKFTNEAAIKFTKGSVALLVAWPPPTNTSRKKLFFLDVYFWGSFLIAQTMLMALANGMYVHRKNSRMIIELMCLAITTISMCIKMIICRWQRLSLQSIIEEMENIIKQAAPYEQAILEKYVNRSAILHISLTIGFYLAGTNIALGPIFLPQSLPNFSAYPFDTESHPIYEIIYFQQALIAVLSCTAAAIDCQVALLLWFAGARFEILKTEFANIVDEYDLIRCIKKHGQIISYAEKISDEVAVKYQYLVLDIVAVIQLFLNSHPAENLIEMSTAIGTAAYNLNWMDNSRKMWHNVCFLIQRSQKPITVSIPGFIPALSLTYYMSFLSSSFSYFTTLRAFVK